VKIITVAAAVILNEQNQLLLVRKQNTQAFMQVGGKLEVDGHLRSRCNVKFWKKLVVNVN